jgi:superfamily I DNA/RNA helicase
MLGHWWIDPAELNDEQRGALTLPEDESHLVTGPPGSGKTNLLVLRATQIIRGGKPNLKLLVFNRTLEEFIANNPTPYALPRENIKTFRRWEMELIHQLGGTPSKSTSFHESRLEDCRNLRSLCESQKIWHVHDLILLDEVQDYLDEEIELVLRLGKTIFAAGDDRQSIYSTTTPMAILEDHCNLHSLSFHYRNGRKICELADQIGKSWTDYIPLCDHSQYNEKDNPSKVQSFRCRDIEEQGKQIVQSLRTQLTAFPGEMLGVMCPLRDDLEVVRAAFTGTDLAPHVVYQNSDEGYLPFGSATRICLCTLHSAKGLEFRAAHLAGTDGFRKFRDRQRKMAYTAVTRAKTSLTVYDCGSPPAFIEGALAALAPHRKPKIDDLFKA